MRTTINISFPDDLYFYIRERVDAGAYASTSEFIRALVREDRARQSANAEHRSKPKPFKVRKANDDMADFYKEYNARS